MKMESTLLQIGIALALRLIFGKDDSTELEAKILAAETKKETVEVLAGAAVAAAMDKEELDEASGKVVDAMVAARSREDLEAIISTPESKVTILDIAWSIVTFPFKIFGG